MLPAWAHCFLHQQRSAKVRFALNAKTSARPRYLRSKFGEHDLFRKKLNDDLSVGRRKTALAELQCDEQEHRANKAFHLMHLVNADPQTAFPKKPRESLRHR